MTTRPSDQDRRSKLVKITAKGLNLLPSVQIEVARAQERTLAPLAPKERVELVRLLLRIRHDQDLALAVYGMAAVRGSLTGHRKYYDAIARPRQLVTIFLLK